MTEFKFTNHDVSAPVDRGTKKERVTVSALIDNAAHVVEVDFDKAPTREEVEKGGKGALEKVEKILTEAFDL